MGQFRTREHPDTDQLIDYLDGSVEGVVQRHLEQCDHCLDQLDQIRQTRSALLALPLQSPPAQAWAGIQARLDDRSRAAHWWTVNPRWLSAAASVMLLGIMLYLFAPLNETMEGGASDYLVNETRNLESILSYLDEQEKPMDLRAAGRIAQLEDSIGAIDVALGEHVGSEGVAAIKQDLIEQRVNLLRNLVAARAQPMAAAYRAY